VQINCLIFLTSASQASLSEQTKGMALGSKLTLDVMGCEVDRLYQLCAKQLVPIKIEVPRRVSDLFSYRFRILRVILRLNQV